MARRTGVQPLVTAGLACLFALLLSGVLGVQQCRAVLPGSALLTAVGAFGLASAIRDTGTLRRAGVTLRERRHAP